jgi:hypothetical protein
MPFRLYRMHDEHVAICDQNRAMWRPDAQEVADRFHVEQQPLARTRSR